MRGLDRSLFNLVQLCLFVLIFVWFLGVDNVVAFAYLFSVFVKQCIKLVDV